MVLARWLFPPQGGGWLRRYMRHRKDMLGTMMLSSDMYPAKPVTIFDFKDQHDAADARDISERGNGSWRVSDDRVIGGFSQAAATLEESEMTLPYIRWNGSLDTTVGLSSDAQRSGFAAIRSPEFAYDGADLRGLFEALEIICRSDGRKYTLNLKVSSYIPDDIYQSDIMTPASAKEDDSAEFHRIVIPFAGMRATSRGREREVLRELDSDVKIVSLGLTLMDGVSKEFQFDLARIRAVNMYAGEVFEGPSSADDASQA